MTLKKKIFFAYCFLVMVCWPAQAHAVISLITVAVFAAKAVAMMVVSVALGALVGYLTYESPDAGEAAGLSDFDFPTTMQGRMVPVVFGSPRLKGINDLWHGDLTSKAITVKVAKNGLFGNHKNEPTGRYEYFLGFHYGICNTADEILEIRMGEEVLWSGSILANTQLSIDKPYLYGGKESQGGIIGEFDVMFGLATQPVNTYLDAKISGDVPAYRGLVSIVSRKACVGTSAYIKPMDVILRRTQTDSYGDPIWYPAKASITGAEGVVGMNVVHCIHEMITDPEYSLAFSDAIDYASFTEAADTCYTEGFGLSFVWDRPTTGIKIIEEVLGYIDGVLRVNPQTNKFELKLLRDDLIIDDLPIVTNRDLIDIDGPTKDQSAVMPNMVQVTYTDPLTRAPAILDIRNEALVSAHGPIAKQVSAEFLLDKNIANKLGTMILRRLSVNPSRMTLNGFKSLANYNKGDAIRLQLPEEGIVDSVFRVLSVDYGSLTDGKVTIAVEEDIYYRSDAIYSAPNQSGWADEAEAPIDLLYRAVIETPYFSLIAQLGETIAAELDSETGRALVCGAATTGNATDVYAMARTGTDAYLYDEGSAAYSPYCETNSAITQGVTDITVPYTTSFDLIGLQLTGFEWVVIDDEILKITGHDEGAFTITLARGCLDTVPKSHSIGASIWFFGENGLVLSTEYQPGVSVDVKLVPATTLGRLDPALATSETVVMDTRYIRPYNGANFRGSQVVNDIVFNWAHRNRLTQVNEIVEQSMTGLTAEVGTTYTFIAKDDGVIVNGPVTGLTAETFTYLEADLIADFGSVVNALLPTSTFHLKSIRGGYESWQEWEINAS